jgi:tetratricopeptide (TPR) repeat protein
MPKKKPDPAPTQPAVPSPEFSPLSFTIETFDDPETGQPTQYGRFSRHWQDEEALDVLIDKLEAGQLSHKQALMQARKLEATTPYNLEIQNFIANRLWALGLQDEATEVYERAYKQALAHIPKGFKGQITWSEVDNRPFLRLAHGTLLGLMRRRDKAKGGEAAMALAKQMLAWCPMDNIGVRFLLGDIALLQGDHKAALHEYLKGASNSPAHWYQQRVYEDIEELRAQHLAAVHEVADHTSGRPCHGYVVSCPRWHPADRTGYVKVIIGIGEVLVLFGRHERIQVHQREVPQQQVRAQPRDEDEHQGKRDADARNLHRISAVAWLGFSTKRWTVMGRWIAASLRSSQ